MTKHKRAMLADLLKYLREIPLAHFDYSTWFTSSKEATAGELNRIFQSRSRQYPECGTTACAAGHYCIMKKLHDAGSGSPGLRAQYHIGLTGEEATFLFYVLAMRANRRAALRRIKWVLDGKPIAQYSFADEAKATRNFYLLVEIDWAKNSVDAARRNDAAAALQT